MRQVGYSLYASSNQFTAASVNGVNVTKEKQNISEVSVANAYSQVMTRNFCNKSKAKEVGHSKEEERKDTILYQPYIQGLTENLERAVKERKLKTVFKTTLTLEMLTDKVQNFCRHHQHQWSCTQDSVRVWNICDSCDSCVINNLSQKVGLSDHPLAQTPPSSYTH